MPENIGQAFGQAFSQAGRDWLPAMKMLADRKRQSTMDQFNRVMGLEGLKLQHENLGLRKAEGARAERRLGDAAEGRITSALTAGEDFAESKRRFDITSGFEERRVATGEAREERFSEGGADTTVSPKGIQLFRDVKEGVQKKTTTAAKGAGGQVLGDIFGSYTISAKDEEGLPYNLDDGRMALDTTTVDFEQSLGLGYKEAGRIGGGEAEDYKQAALSDPDTRVTAEKLFGVPETKALQWTPETKKKWSAKSPDDKLADLMSDNDRDGRIYAEEIWDQGYGRTISGTSMKWSEIPEEWRDAAIKKLMEVMDQESASQQGENLPGQRVGG